VKTIPRTLVRLLGVVALAAPAILVGSSNAHAAIRIFAANPRTCVGTEVLRCLELHYDDVNERYRARAEITDADGGGDFGVNIDNVAAGPKRTSGDVVYNSTWERLESPLVSCTQGDALTVNFTATFSWINNATGLEGTEFRGGVAIFHCT
jgi:hypothetical protein